MKVLLLQDVSSKGNAGKVIDVKEGYATNYLFPNGLATPDLDFQIDSLKAKVDPKKIKSLLKKLSKATLLLKKTTNEQGNLYSAVSPNEIQTVLAKKVKGFEMNQFLIKFEEPIKTLGEHKAAVTVGGESVNLKITVQESGK